MDLHLTGKRALVTGASKGIGYASALMLAAEGCNLVLVSRDRTTLAAAADTIRSRHQVSVDIIPADLSSAAEVERVAAEAGGLDILVNNAGAIPQGDLLGLDDATWRSAWDLKVFGFIGLTRALYPKLKASRGVVVNVIGAASEWLDPLYLAGSTGNAALVAFTKTVGKAAPKDGCRVVGINPGPVATGRMERTLRGRAKREWGDETRWQEFYATMPFGRPATPEEIAAAVAFLASPRSAYTTGTILTIDGAPK
jgi:NAD(P)-dependent dehydrogenase (short-subunit alcohol dehydrogenase family)